jgi:hypothetical protein
VAIDILILFLAVVAVVGLALLSMMLMPPDDKE